MVRAACLHEDLDATHQYLDQNILVFLRNVGSQSKPLKCGEREIA